MFGLPTSGGRSVAADAARGRHTSTTSALGAGRRDGHKLRWISGVVRALSGLRRGGRSRRPADPGRSPPTSGHDALLPGVDASRSRLDRPTGRRYDQPHNLRGDSRSAPTRSFGTRRAPRAFEVSAVAELATAGRTEPERHPADDDGDSEAATDRRTRQRQWLAPGPSSRREIAAINLP